MTRFTPLSVAAGLFAAIALPLRTGAANEESQNVDAWFGQHQTSLTMALDEHLSAPIELPSQAKKATATTAIRSQTIPVSTVPVKRLTSNSAI